MYYINKRQKSNDYPVVTEMHSIKSNAKNDKNP